MKYSLSLSIAALFFGAGLASADHSTFQNTCSDITFMYEGANAAIGATCLRANGTPNKTSVLIDGISNQNGTLTMTGGSSSFQQSCGNIDLSATPSKVTLSAFCRTTSGSSKATVIELKGYSNQNGVLTN